MRLILAVFCFSFGILSCLPAQILNGKIHKGLSKNEGVQGVRIDESIYEPSTAFSDAMGQFSLELPGAMSGDGLDLELYMEGYAVINREALKPILPSSEQDTIHIYLCSKAQRDQLAVSFYEIRIRSNMEISYEKELKPLLEKRDAKAITELYKKKEAAEKMVDSLASRFAKFDPERASEELTRAMQLNQEGKVDEALKLLDLEKIVGRIELKKDVIAGLESNQVNYLNNLIMAANRAAQEGKVEEATKYYEKAIEADSSQIENINTYCLFLVESGQTNRLIPYAKLLGQQPSDPKFQTLSAYYFAIGYLEEGELALAEKHLRLLLPQEGTSDSEEQLISPMENLKLWTRLARAYVAEGQIEIAAIAYEQAVAFLPAINPNKRMPEESVPFSEDLIVLGELDPLSESEAAIVEKLIVLLSNHPEK